MSNYVYSITELATEESVYIGSTLCVRKRKYEHGRERFPPTLFRFDILAAFETSREMLAYELELIHEFKPKYNKAGVVSRKGMGKGMGKGIGGTGGLQLAGAYKRAVRSCLSDQELMCYDTA